MEDYRTSWTGEVTCPYCGHKESDSWELCDSDDEFECGNCEKVYGYERHIEVTYTSYKIKEEGEN